MRRRLAACAVGSLLGAAAVPLLPGSVAYASTLCGATPSVSSIQVQPPGQGILDQQYGPVGSTVTVNGSGFTSLTCNRVLVNLGTSNFTVTASPSQFSFTTAAGMSGTLGVAEVDGNGNTTSFDSHLVYVTTPTGNSLDNRTPFAGATPHLVGSGFDFHLQSGWEQYSAVYRWQAGPVGSSCPSLPSTAPSLADDAHLNLPMPGAYCDGMATVTLSAPCSTNGVACPNGQARMALPSLSAPFDIAPRLTSFPSTGTAGQSATVTGTGFGSGGGSIAVNGTAAGYSSWHDTSVVFTVPPDATSGPLQLSRALDGVDFFAPQQVPTLDITAAVAALAPSSAAVGDSVTVSGAGFGQQGSVSVGATAATVQSWSTTSVTFTVPADATTGPVNLSPSGNSPPATPPTLTVVARITGITPAHATAGALVEIDGTTFGTQQGTVDMGGQPAQVTLWGDKSVLAMVPPSLSPGPTTVTLTPPGAASATAPFAVDVPPTPTPSASKSSSSSSSSSSSATPTPGLILPNPAGPIIAHGYVPFTKPSPPPGPVSLKLQGGAERTEPGGTVDFTVTLMAFGKPIVGAPVDLILVIEPGSDASIDPTHAVTDANGQVKGEIHLSRTPGDHIVMARSGIYSDEIRVVGGSDRAVTAGSRAPGVAGPPSQGSPILAVRSPVLWALIACLLLFGLGFGLNLVTSPSASGAAVMERPGGSPARRRGVMALGDAVRFAGAVVMLAGASALGAVRRPRRSR